jgi:hypothetical protein
LLQPIRLPLPSDDGINLFNGKGQTELTKIDCLDPSLDEMVDFGGKIVTDWLNELDQSLIDCKLVMANGEKFEGK